MDYSSGQKSALGANERAALMSNIKQQLDVAHAQELLQQVSEKCFKMCIQKPGSSLSSSDQKCLTYCMDRYFDAFNIVGRAYSQRLQKELANAR
ncbi:unnamed protein product [Brachionus calyciflorus]|uniref:Mitochondrial import inner membrane translocase subunit n=1 Tax=Brachionus calyciflorus TaxID=104777 RepID=A0A813ZFV4_9BILA|nr:unnamed protein product [Brachionus calyciflorus]